MHQKLLDYSGNISWSNPVIMNFLRPLNPQRSPTIPTQPPASPSIWTLNRTPHLGAATNCSKRWYEYGVTKDPKVLGWRGQRGKLVNGKWFSKFYQSFLLLEVISKTEGLSRNFGNTTADRKLRLSSYMISRLWFLFFITRRLFFTRLSSDTINSTSLFS